MTANSPRDLLKLFRGAFCKSRGQIGNLINPEARCETFTKHSSSDLTFFGIGWQSLRTVPFGRGHSRTVEAFLEAHSDLVVVAHISVLYYLPIFLLHCLVDRFVARRRNTIPL